MWRIRCIWYVRHTLHSFSIYASTKSQYENTTSAIIFSTFPISSLMFISIIFITMIQTLSCLCHHSVIYGSGYSRMDQVKFVKDSLGLCSPQHFKFFEGCLPQILFGPFLNTLTWDIIETYLTHFMPLMSFYSPLIENERFGNIGSSYKNKPGTWNGLTV